MLDHSGALGVISSNFGEQADVALSGISVNADSLRIILLDADN